MSYNSGNDNDDRPHLSNLHRFDDRVNRIIVRVFILIITAVTPALALVAWNDHQAIIELKAATTGINTDHELLTRIGILQDQYIKSLAGKLDSSVAEEHWRLLIAQDAQLIILINQAQARMDRIQASLGDMVIRKFIIEHEPLKPDAQQILKPR